MFWVSLGQSVDTLISEDSVAYWDQPEWPREESMLVEDSRSLKLIEEERLLVERVAWAPRECQLPKEIVELRGTVGICKAAD